MNHSFNDLFAIAVLLLWLAIPLFWIPVHCVPEFFHRLGFLTYILPLITWLPIAYIMFEHRDILLRWRLGLPSVTKAICLFFFVLGAALQVWTLFLMTLPVITGMPEASKSVPGRLVTTGPFAVVRHPTYVSHALMLRGVFFEARSKHMIS